MATYKKRGYKKSITKPETPVAEQESTTAEVFERLDTGASKTEEFVAKNQNIILGVIGAVALGVLSFLGYQQFVAVPNEQEAINELNQAQYYFDMAVNSTDSDSLYLRALNGGDGKYGFLDIIENYSGTPAAKLATYSAGMSYLNLKEYKNAITYLDQFNAEDILLSALAKGAIGDAFAQIGQLEDAFDYYVEASAVNENLFSTPKYLFKAATIGASLGKNEIALTYLKRIKEEFPSSKEAELVDVQLGRLENRP
ncbi:MAG: hypothetical protein ACON47_02830 [Flavobacteriaceae bacterium]